MAATIATCIGCDKSRCKKTTRLGSVQSIGRADTWRTFTTCSVLSDGSGFVQVKRDGEILHDFQFGPEEKP